MREKQNALDMLWIHVFIIGTSFWWIYEH